MTILKNVTEVKFQEDGCFVKHNNGGSRYNAGVGTVSFDTPVKTTAEIYKDMEDTRVVFMPDKPVACWINDHETGDDMLCDSMEIMKKKKWEERDGHALQRRLDDDLTGQDEESYY